MCEGGGCEGCVCEGVYVRECVRVVCAGVCVCV